MGYNSPLVKRLGLVELYMVVIFWKDPPGLLIYWLYDRAKIFISDWFGGPNARAGSFRGIMSDAFWTWSHSWMYVMGGHPLSDVHIIPDSLLLSCFWSRTSQLFLIQILTVYLGDHPVGRKRRFWFRRARKPARPLSPSAPARCGGRPVKQDCSAGRKGLCLCRTAPKPAQLSTPTIPLPCGKSSSTFDSPLGSGDLSWHVLTCPPAHLLPPTVPLLHWPGEQKPPCKQERVLLAWPQFPTSACLLCRNQRHGYEQGTVAQPLPPAAPKLTVVWGQGLINRAPLQVGKDYTNSRPLCCPAGPHLQAYVHSPESSPGRRHRYWLWKDEGRNISPLLEVFKLLCTEIC